MNRSRSRSRRTRKKAVRAWRGVQHVLGEVNPPATTPAAPGPAAWSHQNKLPGIGRVVAVASGKGGVGKSTVSLNLAFALRHLGAQVGLLDCDIYGPSIPLMMGVQQRPTISPEEKLVPPDRKSVV